ncbi:MAG: substrate-binding domain-containing protein, partial [Spirochaetaceae bacterium]|nr:substrate-binding domain-containing protein [Spirochaetaceae bacterium]
SFRVGKQVRINRAAIDAYVSGGAAGSKPAEPLYPSLTAPSPASPPPERAPYPPGPEETAWERDFIICGQDISIDIMVNYLDINPDAARIYRSYLGSYNALYALYHGQINMAVIHLWDGDLDEYNVSFVRKMLPGIPARIMRIGERRHGFYVKKGNPKRLTGWNDLRRGDIVIANREKGSGTRVLLDESLRLMNIRSGAVQGYGNEYRSHLAVAGAVVQGTADFALGSESGCKTVGDVDFIPLKDECHDLVIRLADAERQPYRKILDIVLSAAFRKDLESIGGYNTRQTGSILW